MTIYLYSIFYFEIVVYAYKMSETGLLSEEYEYSHLIIANQEVNSLPLKLHKGKIDY